MSTKDDLDLDNIVDHDDAEELTDRGDTVDDADDGETGAKDDAGKDVDEDEDTGEEEAEGDEQDDSEEDKDEDKDEDEDKDKDEDDTHDKSDPNPMIPRARLNQVQAKRREAEAKAAKLEAELSELREKSGASKEQEEFTARVDELYENVEKARAEGDYKGAARMQKELDKLRDEANSQGTQYMAAQQAAAQQNLTAYNAVVDQVETLVPELNPKNDAFDEDLASDVQAVCEGYEGRGRAPADALKRALKNVLGRDVFSTPEKPPGKKRTDVKKNVKAAKKTPPDSQAGAAPERNSEIKVDTLSDEEFDKLPESTKKRLRGDFVEA